MRAPPLARVDWRAAYRIVPSRFPPVGVFDRIADPHDLDALYAIESLTNDRLRNEVGALHLVPPERRVTGPGTTPVMAAFTHINPEGSRFSDGRYGVFYAAHNRDTAIDETVYHRERFLASTREAPTDIEMRCYGTRILANLHDVRGGWPAVHSPTSYAASRKLGTTLRAQGSDGVVYDSARRRGGECVGVFYPDRVAACVQRGHYLYRWNGARISAVLEIGAIRER